ncbi:MAG: efflux RND transporter periplasmic adaptor subunit [Akkermansiaceae bacterium]
MKAPVFSLVVIVVIGAVTFGVTKLLEAIKPEAEKKDRSAPTPVVEVVKVERKDLPFPLSSEGIVTTRRETILSSEVGGKIIEVHEHFEVGAAFKAGEVIARIDSLNFETAVDQAQSAVADAKLALEVERARGEQASRDWAKISPGKQPSEMVLRVPHLKSAEAKLTATQANLEQATEDLERTKIKAPFDCRVRSVSLNLGATVAPGTQLGMIYDPERVMVRLAFSMDDFARVGRDAVISLSASIGGIDYEWTSKILWDEGEVDRATLSAYVLAEVQPNEDVGKRFRLPPPGLFVKADLDGKEMKDVVAVPRAALRGKDRVAVLDSEKKLQFRQLEIVRSSESIVYASTGVEDGDLVILTRLDLPREGMILAVAGEEESAQPTEE